ncbi:MAG: PEP-CTERM sorting domain-containing protein [Planctomycetota bacterium]|jgi:hypothetical protein
MSKPIICTLLVFSFALAARGDVIPPDALVNFEVAATAGWVLTGLQINAGDQFAMVATGLAAESLTAWQNSPRTPDGSGSCFDPPCLVNLPDSRYALVGQIGSSQFIVGSSFQGVAADSGILQLAFNDSFHGDNFGSYFASTTAVPEPSTALLLASGLAALAVGRRRRAL